MKWVVLFFSLFTLNSLGLAKDSQVLNGIVKLSSSVQKKIGKGGILYVFARNLEQEFGPPVAVLRIEKPEFPQKFELGPNQIMIPGTPFAGPFKIVARYSPSGDALQKKGSVQGEVGGKTGFKAGSKNIEVILNEAL